MLLACSERLQVAGIESIRDPFKALDLFISCIFLLLHLPATLHPSTASLWQLATHCRVCSSYQNRPIAACRSCWQLQHHAGNQHHWDLHQTDQHQTCCRSYITACRSLKQRPAAVTQPPVASASAASAETAPASAAATCRSWLMPWVSLELQDLQGLQGSSVRN